MNTITNFLIGLLLAKALWNIYVPIGLVRAALKSDTKKISGVTLMPYLDVGIILLATLSAALSSETTWHGGPRNVALWGVLTIITSYALMLVLGRIAGWIVIRSKNLTKKL
jgi:hypothetical protein